MAAKKKTKSKPKKKKTAARRGHAAMQSVAHHSPATSGHHWQKNKYTTLKEFWPFYLNEHSRKSNRALHFIGTSIGLVLIAVALLSAKYILIAAGLTSGYAFAWVGHFFIEKNRPATFTYPIMSFISDWRMWYCTFMDKTEDEMRRFGIRPQ